MPSSQDSKYNALINIKYEPTDITMDPGQRRTAENGRFRGIPEISWKQYSDEQIQ